MEELEQADKYIFTLEYELDEANSEIRRHHKAFMDIQALLDKNDLDSTLWETTVRCSERRGQILKEIRKIVG